MTKVYELLQVRVSGRYPVRDSYDRSLGIYSSLGKAYEAMQTSIKKEKGWVTLSEILCYIIYEKRLDARPYAEEVFIHTYTREGNLNDEWFVADEDDEEQINLKPYYGCPKEKIRFKRGDIVEEWCGNKSYLSIVATMPNTTEDFLKAKLRWEESYKKWGHSTPLFEEKRTIWDSTNYCYSVYSLGEGDTHSHPFSPYLFAPTRKVPLTLKRKLEKKLEEMNILYNSPKTN